VSMLVEQVRADLIAFSRRPETLFFTVFLPVIFLVLFEAIFGDQEVDVSSKYSLAQSTLQVPAFMAMGIVSASFVALSITMVNRRETGIFKRVRGTPAPASVLILGQVVTSLLIGIVMVVVMLLIGWLAYGVEVSVAHIPWLIGAVLFGAAVFSCLGIALAAVTPSMESAPALANILVLPLYFVSGVFVPVDALPSWLSGAASVFPIAPFVTMVTWPYDPAAATPWLSVLVLGAWGLLGLIVAARLFRWTPIRG
jgi:ABC-2 type transport system permease protein